jgi:hypothetical protein
LVTMGANPAAPLVPPPLPGSKQGGPRQCAAEVEERRMASAATRSVPDGAGRVRRARLGVTDGRSAVFPIPNRVVGAPSRVPAQGVHRADKCLQHAYGRESGLAPQ